MPGQADDFNQSDFLKSGFIKDWQVLAQQSWDAWLQQLQSSPATVPAAGNDTLERVLAGLKGCFDWMQSVAAAGASQPDANWETLLRAWAGSGNQPFTQAFGGIDNAAAQGFVQQWQSWLQSAQQDGFVMPAGVAGSIPAFGLHREQWMQQQELAAAIQAAMQANARYHELIQRANTQGLASLQAKLAERSEAGPKVESLKSLYDLWVDAAEEAYAEIALSDEFRNVYGEMVNAQMRVRQMQQRHTEQLCRELGVPTRSEVDSLGRRLQEIRREMAALKREHGVGKVKQAQSAPATAKPAAKKVAGKAASTATKRASTAKSPTSASSLRKRK